MSVTRLCAAAEFCVASKTIDDSCDFVRFHYYLLDIYRTNFIATPTCIVTMADTENQPTATTNDADNGEVKEAVAADEKTATATNGSGDATETTSPAKEEPKDSANGWEKAEDIYGFSAVDIDGKEVCVWLCSLFSF